MKVYVIEHEYSDEKIYCPTKEQALETLALCVNRQDRGPVAAREAVTLSIEKISKREWDTLDDVPDDYC